MNSMVYGYQKFSNSLSNLRPHIESYRDGTRRWKKESDPPYANKEFEVDSLQHQTEEQTAKIIDLEDSRQQSHREMTNA